MTMTTHTHTAPKPARSLDAAAELLALANSWRRARDGERIAFPCGEADPAGEGFRGLEQRLGIRTTRGAKHHSLERAPAGETAPPSRSQLGRFRSSGFGRVFVVVQYGPHAGRIFRRGVGLGAAWREHGYWAFSDGTPGTCDVIVIPWIVGEPDSLLYRRIDDAIEAKRARLLGGA